ncbi:MAG: 30S ribosomal protein S4 [Patescibacteria group bacterium]
MARYTGSKTKLSKRVGRDLFLKGSRSYSAKSDYPKRPNRAGEHSRSRPKKVSEYGKQLLEKQALRYTYGLVEKQLANLFKKAFKQTGDTGKIALTNLERRIDNVIYRGGLANSRSQARQLVNHGHFEVNGRRVNIPSFLVSVNDVISVKENKKKNPFWQNFKLEVPNKLPSWIEGSKKSELKIINLPLEADLPDDFKVGAIVEFYSRKVA